MNSTETQDWELSADFNCVEQPPVRSGVYMLIDEKVNIEGYAFFDTVSGRWRALRATEAEAAEAPEVIDAQPHGLVWCGSAQELMLDAQGRMVRKT